ncbi:uncharacterized protein [Oscarella lobularis]|uniref:uncharacterized protein isoform X2 n=1 Tax=Oscarella lobularis TaxID=121494 RepID=UPI0033141528
MAYEACIPLLATVLVVTAGAEETGATVSMYDLVAVIPHIVQDEWKDFALKLGASPDVVNILEDRDGDWRTTRALRKILADFEQKEGNTEKSRQRLIDACKSVGLGELLDRSLTRKETFYHFDKQIFSDNTNLYQEALLSGETSVVRSRIVVVGKDSVGKTSLIDTLLLKPFSEKNSTLGVKITLVTITAANWREENGSDYADKGIATAILDIERKMPSKISEEQQTVKNLSMDSSEYEQYKLIRSNVLAEGKRARDSLVLTVWDHGGQEAFLPAHSALLGDYSLFSTGIYLIVFNQAELLSDPAQSFLRDESGLSKQELHFFETNSDYLSTWMTHITIAHGWTQTDDEYDIVPPPTFLVGTHDNHSQAHQNRADQKIILEQLVERKQYQKHLVRTEGNEIFWRVENSESGKPGKDPGQRLREKIELLTTEYWRKLRKSKPEVGRLPARWFKVEKELYRMTNVTVAVDDLRNIAKEHLVENLNEFYLLLNYLQSLGIILFYPETKGIERTIFIKPQWLVDVICSFLTAKQPRAAKHKTDWDTARTNGSVSMSLAQYFLKSAGVDESRQTSVLAILELLDIVCLPNASIGVQESAFLYVPYLIQKNDTETLQFWKRESSWKFPYPIIFAPAVSMSVDNFPEPLYFRLVTRCLRKYPSARLTRNRCRFRSEKFSFELVYFQKRYVIAYIEHKSSDMAESHLRRVSSRLLKFLRSELEEARLNGMKGFLVDVCIQTDIFTAGRIEDRKLVLLDQCLQRHDPVVNRGNDEIWLDELESPERVFWWNENETESDDQVSETVRTSEGIVFQLVFTVFIVLGVIWAIEFTLCGVKKLEGHSVYEMTLKELVDIIVDCGHHKWRSIGLKLNFKWRELVSLTNDYPTERNEYKLRSLLEEYQETNGDCKETKMALLQSCIEAKIGGLVRDSLIKKGYFWEIN